MVASGPDHSLSATAALLGHTCIKKESAVALAVAEAGLERGTVIGHES